MEIKLLSHETLYIFYFFKKNRLEYYARLMEVRSKGNYEKWIKFSLLAIYEPAQDAIATMRLHNRNFEAVANTGKASKTISKVFNYLESSPIIDIKETSNELKISFNAASNEVDTLVDLGILRQT